MGISVGIIGVGSFGPQFIKLFKVHPDVDRLALYDLKPDRLSRCSKAHQISETYSSLDDICKSDLDAWPSLPSIGCMPLKLCKR